jgi:type VI secretion system protein ImpM
MAASLFGKYPLQGDFVRIACTSGESLAFATFLESALEPCRRLNCALPDGGAAFLFREEDARLGLVGFMKPSVDSVGRVFPLSIFAPVDLKRLAKDFAGIPAAFDKFLADAGALISEAPKLELPALAEKLAALAPPSPDDIAAAATEAESTFEGTTASTFGEVLFGPTSGGRQCYAFRAMASVCVQARQLPPGKLGVTVDCPALDTAHVSAWLEMVRRMVGPARWRTPPLVFWTRPGKPRSYGSFELKSLPKPRQKMLVSFGAPNAAALTFLAGADRDNNKLWPIETDNTKAIDAARQGLTDRQRATLDSEDTTLADIVQILT